MLSKIQGKESLQNDLIKGLQASAKELDATITNLGLAAPTPAAEPEPRPATATPPKAVTPPAPKAVATQQAFNQLKGLLNLPVSGKIVSSYGHYRNVEFNVMNCRSGVLIRADRGEPIHAVANGTTLFADWFKGYGNMLIIDHGHSYCTLYAHMEELFKKKGDTVESGEVIATVGDSGTLSGPGLYFEVRHHGKPEDPLQWLKEKR